MNGTKHVTEAADLVSGELCVVSLVSAILTKW